MCIVLLHRFVHSKSVVVVDVVLPMIFRSLSISIACSFALYFIVSFYRWANVYVYPIRLLWWLSLFSNIRSSTQIHTRRNISFNFRIFICCSFPCTLHMQRYRHTHFLIFNSYLSLFFISLFASL